jgi:hypothetical protein
MDRLTSFSTGTKLFLAGAVLLFLDLFLTWQNLPLDFGRRTDITRSLDAWDLWGLLIGLLTLGLIAAVIFGETYDELELDSRFELALFAGSSLVLAIAVVKNLLDAGSAWASYLGILLAALMTFGAFRDWKEAREDESSVELGWWASPAGTPRRGQAAQDEQRPSW